MQTVTALAMGLLMIGLPSGLESAGGQIIADAHPPGLSVAGPASATMPGASEGGWFGDLSGALERMRASDLSADERRMVQAGIGIAIFLAFLLLVALSAGRSR